MLILCRAIKSSILKETMKLFKNFKIIFNCFVYEESILLFIKKN